MAAVPCGCFHTIRMQVAPSRPSVFIQNKQANMKLDKEGGIGKELKRSKWEGRFDYNYV